MAAAGSASWEQLLAYVREDADLGDPIAERLEGADGFTVRLPEQAESSAEFEPFLSLLRVYQRLDRALSEVLYRRSYNEEPPLMRSDFGDWAVGSLAREAYLDLHLAGAAFAGGLDLQAMCLLRQMAELVWRALVVVADPEVADEWWASVLASTGTGERVRIEKQLWAKHFRPAKQIEDVGRIEARLLGLDPRSAEVYAKQAIRELSDIYSLLSGATHGGTDLVYASVTRGRVFLPEDPFESLGEPTELGKRLMRAALYLQGRFWRYFPLAAGFPLPGLGDSPDAALLAAAPALNALLRSRYAAYTLVPEG